MLIQMVKLWLVWMKISSSCLKHTLKNCIDFKQEYNKKLNKISITIFMPVIEIHSFCQNACSIQKESSEILLTIYIFLISIKFLIDLSMPLCPFVCLSTPVLSLVNTLLISNLSKPLRGGWSKWSEYRLTEQHKLRASPHFDFFVRVSWTTKNTTMKISMYAL